MKKLAFYLILLILSIFIFLNLDTKEKLDIPIKEYETFPPKEYLDKLEDMQVQ